MQSAYPPFRAHASACRLLDKIESVAATFLKQLAEGLRSRSVLRIAQILTILASMQAAITERATVSRRAVYYENPALFGTQARVDELVRELCSALSAPAWTLGIAAASKGLWAGNLSVVYSDFTTLRGHHPAATSDGNDSTQLSVTTKEHLIGNVESIVKLSTSAGWICVVEKEAVFRSLLADSSYLREYGIEGSGAVITGKGYPDVATRSFLKLLSTSFPSIPLFLLVDSDPFGLDIARIYRFGSISPEPGDVESLALPQIRLLQNSRPLGEYDNSQSSVLQLTCRDRNKARSLLRLSGHRQLPEEWRTSLSLMIWTGKKAEL
ncbi:meiotic recombination protein spo11 [Ceraceosorus bombacis]|uniref:DNA topoisomerase (ATP-hydrolyzing) n=1 Tax=Ceraceosorus bombacis TaxID=401625 RepID=A0A0N7LAP1_9BASI|nr:meiotic recombination protein spo11 [Ceraceosorus bombacis]